jgi:HD-GYP domain-containing protein (c-di-GMP phosphodiesterase class II)
MLDRLREAFRLRLQPKLAPGQWRRNLPVYLAIAAGLGLSLGLFCFMRHWERTENQSEFGYASSHFVEALRRATERIAMTHKIIRRDFDGSPNVSRQEFSLLADDILAYVPSLKVLQWAPRVPRNGREQFEQAARSEGWPKYAIVQPDARGQLVPARVRNEYYPIWYAASRRGFEARFGWDFGADPALRNAIEKARDTGEFVVSDAIDLSKIGIDRSVVQTFLAVYDNGAALAKKATPAERRARFRGLLVGLCQPDDMARFALSYAAGPQGIDLAMFDASTPTGRRLLYFHPSRTRANPDSIAPTAENLVPSGIHATESLEFGGRIWSVVCTPAPGFFATHAHWRSWSVLIVGLLATAVAAGYTLGATHRTEKIQRLVEERTLDLRRKDDQLRRAQKLEAIAIRQAHEETIHRLVTASLCRDEETGMHIRRTGLLSDVLARASGWSAADAELLRMAAPMHDVGKIGIPDAVLQKPGRLTSEEFEIMKRHTTIGARMLEGSRSKILAVAKDIALGHHERWDGTGYPQGLAGTNICEAARIVSIVDVYDALSHDRVYRLALPEDEVLKLMQQGAGAQFDPMLLATFFSHFDDLRRISQENPDEAEDAESPTSWMSTEIPGGLLAGAMANIV